MSGGQNYFLPAMDMAKVGGPLSVVKVCMCENRVSVSGWSPIGSKGFCTNLTSQVLSLLLSSSNNFVGKSNIYIYMCVYIYIHTIYTPMY